MRVAIIGFGPRGLFALERLLDHARGLPATSLEIDLFEPHGSLAAGPNYDPGQPGCLRMNYPAERIDMWWPDSAAVPARARRSFVAWRALTGEPDDGAFPSRAAVGRYLSGGLELLLEHAPRHVTVRLRAVAVDRLTPLEHGWEVAADGAPAEAYDEVLVTTGHLPGSPFPVDRWLSAAQIAPGSVVAVRGFALTFLDVALALTDGRDARSAVAAIVPFSRTGRPMLAKPAPAVAAAIPGLEAIAERGRRALLASASPARLGRDVLPILARVVRESLGAAGVLPQRDPGDWLADAHSGVPVVSDLSAAAELGRSLAVADGSAPPDLSWALGHAWRELYPAIVARLGADGLEERDWPAFRHLAAELERVAFGPPPVNAARLLELVDAGRVDLSYVAGGRILEREGRPLVALGDRARPVDAIVDAVLPGPGVRTGSRSLPARLVSDGHARIARFRRGLEVAPDGTCIGRDGTPSHGLAVIGRPTEDWVIGNDTLDRTLHPHVDRWARRVAARCHDDRAEPAGAPS